VVCSDVAAIIYAPLSALTSTIDTSLQATTRKEKIRAPKVAKLMEKLPPLCLLTKTLTNYLSFFFRGFNNPL
jgi:hypothetical protein